MRNIKQTERYIDTLVRLVKYTKIRKGRFVTTLLHDSLFD